MLSKERQEQVVELCQKLIRQQSYSGHEDGVVAELSAQMIKTWLHGGDEGGN